MKTLTVKTESLIEFFQSNLLKSNDRNNDFDRDPNPYYLLKDELFLKKDLFFKDDEQVIDLVHFILKDEAARSRKQLENWYQYSVSCHDDLSVRLELENFSIIIPLS